MKQAMYALGAFLGATIFGINLALLVPHASSWEPTWLHAGIGAAMFITYMLWFAEGE